MVFGLVSSQCPSLTALVSLVNRKITKQALQLWFKEEAVIFLQNIFSYVCSIKLQQIQPCERMNCFSSLLICDSTWLELTKSLKLEDFFKVFGGKFSRTPQCKLQLVFNYLTGAIEQIDVTKSTDNDPSYHQQLLNLLKEKTLLIVDLGYFSLKFFSKINAKGAYFISRLKHTVTVFHAQTTARLDLLKIAKESNENEFEFKALLGKEKLESRIISVKVPKGVAEARRNKYKDACRRKRITVSSQHLELLGWSFFVTNIPEKIMPAAQIILLYSIRWQIELIFKTLKSVLSIDFTMVRENVNRIICEIYGRLILAAFLTKVHSAINEISCKESDTEMSLDKLVKRFKDRSFPLVESLLNSVHKANEYFRKVLDLCFKTCFKERQKTRPTSRKLLLLSSKQSFIMLTHDFLVSLT